MKQALLKITLLLVMAMPSQACLHAQIRIIPRERIDSLSQSRKVRSEDFLRFDALRIDYGTVKESDHSIKRTFRFRNTSSRTVTISGVSTSCTCLTANLKTRTVSPGQTGEIDVVYNQKGHPGRHDRYVYLYTIDEKGSSTLSATLALVGTVVSSDVKLDDYPVEFGFFRLDTSELHFTVGKTQSQSIKLINVSDDAHRLTFTDGLLPQGLKVSAEPSSVPAGGTSRITVTYDGGKTIHASDKSIPVMVDGTGMNRFSSKILVFFRDFQ